MLDTILNALFSNIYLFLYLVGILITFAVGWIVTEESARKLDIKGWQVGGVFSLAWAIFGGVLLLFIWSVLTISDFFGIPLLVLFALIVVVIVGCAILIRVARKIITR